MGTDGLGWGKGYLKVWREGRSEKEQAATEEERVTTTGGT